MFNSGESPITKGPQLQELLEACIEARGYSFVASPLSILRENSGYSVEHCCFLLKQALDDGYLINISGSIGIWLTDKGREYYRMNRKPKEAKIG